MTYPWLCPKHPEAKIKHEWTRVRNTVRITGASWDTDMEHVYSCAVCGERLAASKEEVPHVDPPSAE